MNANLILPITKAQRRREYFPVGRYLFKLLRGIVLLIMMPVFGFALLIGIAQMAILASVTAAILLLSETPRGWTKF